jgi:hypothetical protein
MREMTEAERAAIVERITKTLMGADDSTLREINRMVFSWTLFRKEHPAISPAEKRTQKVN